MEDKAMFEPHPAEAAHEHMNRIEHSDEELVLTSLSDSAVFASLYRRYAVPVYQYCYRCLGNREDAEEATQATFMRALTSLKQCRDPKGFRSWLFAIAHNVIMDLVRKRKPALDLAMQEEYADRSESTESQALEALERHEIHVLLQKLPLDQRNVIELRLQGLNSIEIAKALNKSPGAIRTSQYRATQSLRDLIVKEQRKESGRANS
jgi:RNA polymerase sigma-70 factor, ECF subfamily